MGLGVDLSKLRVGDVIEMKRTLQVQRTEKDYVEAVDVQSDHRFGFTGSDQGGRGTLKLSVVAKAKPKVGDVITGREVKANQAWLRGTTFSVDLPGGPGSTLLLDAEGFMHASSGRVFPVGEIVSSCKFKVLHVA
jgi:hypothetical protein